ncbi:MAG: aspartate kinase [Calditrichaeota bacterium]|nr:aspartate kinase [Calditrichota bacterium]
MSDSFLVIKFDGISLKDVDAMRDAVRYACKKENKHILIVAAAMAGVNNILKAMADALKNRNKDYIAYLNKLETRHLEVAEKLHLQVKGFSDLKNQLGLLRNLALQISNSKKFLPAFYDHILSFGELLSSLLLSDVFEEQEKNTEWFDIRQVIKTDESFGKAVPDLPLTAELAENLLVPILKKNRIVVTQGSIAETVSGKTTFTALGDADHGACISGAVIHAEKIELWTDADELVTADRRLVPNAELITEITYDEAAELAYFANKSLHPAILLPAMQKKVPVQIRSILNREKEGTLILSKRSEGAGVRAIAFKKSINLINIISVNMLGSHGFLSRVFQIFEKHQTAVDMVSTSEISISVTISDYKNLIAICEELSKFARVEIYDKQAMIALIGSKIRNVPGIAARIFTAVKDINVNIISQGASQTNLSFMIDESYVEKAIKALHKEMIE